MFRCIQAGMHQSWQQIDCVCDSLISLFSLEDSSVSAVWPQSNKLQLFHDSSSHSIMINKTENTSSCIISAVSSVNLFQNFGLLWIHRLLAFLRCHTHCYLQRQFDFPSNLFPFWDQMHWTVLWWNICFRKKERSAVCLRLCSMTFETSPCNWMRNQPFAHCLNITCQIRTRTFINHKCMENYNEANVHTGLCFFLLSIYSCIIFIYPVSTPKSIFCIVMISYNW